MFWLTFHLSAVYWAEARTDKHDSLKPDVSVTSLHQRWQSVLFQDTVSLRKEENVPMYIKHAKEMPLFLCLKFEQTAEGKEWSVCGSRFVQIQIHVCESNIVFQIVLIQSLSFSVQTWHPIHFSLQQYLVAEVKDIWCESLHDDLLWKTTGWLQVQLPWITDFQILMNLTEQILRCRHISRS